MTIKDYKLLDTLLMDEVNIKVLEREIADTEKGKLCLNFDRTDYYWTIGGKEVPQLNGQTLGTLQEFYEFYARK